MGLKHTSELTVTDTITAIKMGGWGHASIGLCRKNRQESELFRER